jgi:peptidoglycan/LPS O-acetylase OafA/YrhL
MHTPETGLQPQEQAMGTDLSGIDYRRKFLPGLDTLRCVAASLVVFGHVDTVLLQMGAKHSLYKFFPFLLGDKAVVFFFVLSGFLITWLLLLEKENGPISLRNFYARRIFRIWPVYFIVAIVAVFVLSSPAAFSMRELVLLFLISPNIALVFNSRSLGHAIHTWSIGIEEQFYIFWPLVIRSKYYFRYILYIYGAITILSSGVIWVIGSMPFVPHTLQRIAFLINTFFTFDYSFRIDAMAAGSIGAWLIFNRRTQVLDVVFSRPFQYLSWGVLAFIVGLPTLFPYQFHNLVYLSIIMNVSFNPDTIFKLTNPITTWIGKISYGIYMYHYLFFGFIVETFVSKWGIGRSFWSELLLCFIVLGVSIAVSALSFYAMERPILRLKSRFVDKK